jgi:uncharacterized membrane protein YsdA (DUF1294 family)
MTTIIHNYLVAINIITFFIYGLDKWLAVHDKYRIPEKVLLFLSIIGGAYGGYISMQFFRHKTKKLIFHIINILVIVILSYLLIVN